MKKKQTLYEKQLQAALVISFIVSGIIAWFAIKIFG